MSEARTLAWLVGHRSTSYCTVVKNRRGAWVSRSGVPTYLPTTTNERATQEKIIGYIRRALLFRLNICLVNLNNCLTL